MLIDVMLPLADEAGLTTGRAYLLQWRGYVRVQLGDAAGVGDLRDAAQTPVRTGAPNVPLVYSNLADAVRGLGDMAAADRAYMSAARWASRFALSEFSDAVAVEQSYQAYHSGDWLASRQLLARRSPHPSS